MKQKFFVFFALICVVCLASASYGQRAVVSSEHGTGTFQFAHVPESISVRYSLSAAYPDNLVLQLIPRSEFMLNAHITDAKGREVLMVKPETVTLRYANSLDISKLAPGKYFLEVFNGNSGENGYRIPFNVGSK